MNIGFIAGNIILHQIEWVIISLKYIHLLLHKNSIGLGLYLLICFDYEFMARILFDVYVSTVVSTPIRQHQRQDAGSLIMPAFSM